MPTNRSKKHAKNDSAKYREKLREVFSEELDEELEEQLFEKLYEQACLKQFPDPDDLLCDFDAFEHNNKGVDETRISCLKLFIDTQCQLDKHSRDKKRYEEIVKTATSKLRTKFSRENQSLKEELGLYKKNMGSLSKKFNHVESELYSLKKNVIPQLRKELIELKKSHIGIERLQQQIHAIKRESKQLKDKVSNLHSSRRGSLVSMATTTAETKAKRKSATYRNPGQREALRKKEKEKAKSEKPRKPKSSERASKLLKSATNATTAKPKKKKRSLRGVVEQNPVRKKQRLSSSSSIKNNVTKNGKKKRSIGGNLESQNRTKKLNEIPAKKRRMQGIKRKRSSMNSKKNEELNQVKKQKKSVENKREEEEIKPTLEKKTDQELLITPVAASQETESKKETMAETKEVDVENTLIGEELEKNNTKNDELMTEVSIDLKNNNEKPDDAKKTFNCFPPKTEKANRLIIMSKMTLTSPPIGLTPNPSPKNDGDEDDVVSLIPISEEAHTSSVVVHSAITKEEEEEEEEKKKINVVSKTEEDEIVNKKEEKILKTKQCTKIIMPGNSCSTITIDELKTANNDENSLKKSTATSKQQRREEESAAAVETIYNNNAVSSSKLKENMKQKSPISTTPQKDQKILSSPQKILVAAVVEEENDDNNEDQKDEEEIVDQKEEEEICKPPLVAAPKKKSAALIITKTTASSTSSPQLCKSPQILKNLSKSDTTTRNKKCSLDFGKSDLKLPELSMTMEEEKFEFADTEKELQKIQELAQN